jgi:hypothetical protein
MAIKKIAVGILAVAIIATTLATSVGAIQFSDTNTGIAIVPGAYTGYRFFGPESPHSHINTTQIQYIKFYIMFEDLRHHEPANVLLIYNSGTTGWVTQQHDLNDGLIVEIEITTGGVSLDDFFEVALTTDNSAISGTWSVEVRDHRGQVLGEGVYEHNIPQDTNEVYYDSEGNPEDYQPDYVPEDEYVPETTPEQTTPAPQTTPAQNIPEAGDSGNPETGNANILTATAMTVVSALAILSMHKKNKKEK